MTRRPASGGVGPRGMEATDEGAVPKEAGRVMCCPVPSFEKRARIVVWRGRRVDRMVRRLPAVGLLVAVVASAACSTSRWGQLQSGAPVEPGSTEANLERLATLLDERQQSAADRQYVIAPGDLLIVTVYNFRPGGGNFESDVRVDDRGYISLPMISPVRAAGQSPAEMRAALVAELRQAQILKQPLVSVFLKEYQGQRVIVFGAVARAGQYSLSNGKETLVDVLSMAGGLTERAGNYVLFRPSESDTAGSEPGDALVRGYAVRTVSTAAPQPGAEADLLVLRLFDGERGGNSDWLTLPVRGGDLFLIPEAGQAFVEGEVEKPGPHRLTHGMTLTQLISSAEGLAFPADARRVMLIRTTTSGQGQWEVDLERIRAQEQEDILMDANDRVVVPATAGKKVAYGVYKFVTAVVNFTVGGAASVF